MKSLKAEKEKLTVPQIMIFPDVKTGSICLIDTARLILHFI